MNVRRYASVVLGMVLVAGVFGCGSATNNDQGNSFSFLGFYPEDSTSVTDAGLAGISIPLTSTDDLDEEPNGFGGAAIAAVGVQNNLVGQSVRPQRLYLSYSIPGSSLQPPSTSMALNGLLGPAGTDEDNPSSLPDGVTRSNSAVIEVFVVPFEIREWLAFNRESLPEPPFAMELTATITGITSSGDRLDTNEQFLSITVAPDITIPPSDEESSSSSTGAATDGSPSLSDEPLSE